MVVAVLLGYFGWGPGCAMAVVDELVSIMVDLDAADGTVENLRHQSGYLTSVMWSFCHSLNSPSASTMLLWKAASSGPYSSTMRA